MTQNFWCHAMYILNHWSIKSHAANDGRQRLHLSGKVFGHARFAPGEVISTSAVRRYRFENDSIVTHNGSEYRLGKPEGADPLARKHLLERLGADTLENSRKAKPGRVEITGPVRRPGMHP
jgi:hypothetical protein